MHGNPWKIEIPPVIFDFLANQVCHLDATAPDRLGDRPPGYRANMLLELRYRSAVKRPMSGIVHARRDLVDQELTLAQHEHFHREHADIAELLRNDLGNTPRLRGIVLRQRRRHARRFEDMVAMLVLGDVETFDDAGLAARRDNRNLALERYERFEDAGLSAGLAPSRLGNGAIFDSDL